MPRAAPQTLSREMDRHYSYMWRGADKLAFAFGDQPNGIVNKFVTVKDHVFVATTANDLYHGQVIFPEGQAPRLSLKRAQFDVVDVAANSQYLFVVNTSGHVLKVNPQDLSVLDSIVLREEVKRCIHGYTLENEMVKVKSVAVSDHAALFVTENGNLWVSGNHPQIDICATEPKKVQFFEGKTVTDVACGADFNVVTVRKQTKILKDDTDSDNEMPEEEVEEEEKEEEEEVFVNSCPQCVSNVALSPTSVTSSDTCPMLNSQQFSENRSTNSLSALSAASKDPEGPLGELEGKGVGSVADDAPENGETPFEVADLNKEERRNMMFINAESARQFLSGQLSWISSYGSGKDDVQLESIDRPTRLIKQNVSNMANYVYEGVKNVGGRVVTLSRHMSGSSEMNETNETKEDNSDPPDRPNAASRAMTNSLALSLRCEEFPWSSSAESSEHELSQQGLNERINVLANAGDSLLSCEMWIWGDVQYGQLGTGDIIKRTRPVSVAKLANAGIRKVACGDHHVLALTLDGRVFAWGRNHLKQVCPGIDGDQSSPRLIATNLAENERSKDMSAGAAHSLIMMHHGLYFVGRSSKPGEMFQLDIETAVDHSPRQIFSSGQYSCCSIVNQPAVNISEDLAKEQIFLEEMLTICQNLVEPFRRKALVTAESNVYKTLCRCYKELLSFTVLNVASLWDYSNHIGEAYEVAIVANIEEYTTVHKYYINAICDVIAIGGFAYIAKVIDVPQVICNFFDEKLKASEFKKSTNELVISTALQHPLRKLNRYKGMILSLIRSNGTRMGIERLQEALIKWEQVLEELEKRQKEAESTKLFWESTGKMLEKLRSPERRLIRESRTHPITVLNSGRFSSHSFVLLTDVFIHVTGTSHTAHPLRILWVEPANESDTMQNAMLVVAPEDTLILLTPTAAERSEWLQALQSAIKCSLQRTTTGSASQAPPIARSGSFTFAKHSVFKDAKYTGRWLNGKPHGHGKLVWPDGRVYTGQFHKGIIQGNGRMDISSQGVYEGQWKDGQQNGYGTMKYVNGDFYEGYFKDGLPHGHGIKKEGHFMASGASVYIGEWAAGMKQGYGIMDYIMTGEKYLGSWSNDMKHGCGLIVTLDGIYYEGVFTQDVLTGHGIMIFEDGTHYEGEFKSAGIFCGKGTLTFRSGDKLEGSMNGAWNEGVKVIATLHMNKSIGNPTNSKPTSFGKLCVSPDQKWKAIFRQCHQQLGVSESSGKNGSDGERGSETQRVWQNVATLIIKSHQKARQEKKFSANNVASKEYAGDSIDQLDKIPCFGRDNLTAEVYRHILKYLSRAFESPHHPLGALLTEVATVYTATYGGVRVHPLLLSHAVQELHSITSRIYDILTRLFPALPSPTKEFVLESRQDEQVITPAAILHPILLPRVHSALFVLYALHNKKEDDAYWERLIRWNKQPDTTLVAFLKIDGKFWKSTAASAMSESPMPPQNEPYFSEAIETLQQLKTTFSPLEKLQVVRNTFEQMTQAVQRQLGSTYLWTMDELIPVFSFVVVRASVLQLGSEIHFIEDFMEAYLQHGELGIMFTTLKACYCQILQEKTNMAD